MAKVKKSVDALYDTVDDYNKKNEALEVECQKIKDQWRKDNQPKRGWF